MTIRNLDHLFQPASIAVIGASDRPGRVGTTVWNNLRHGGFAGALHAVNPRLDRLDGMPCHARVGQLPACPDLAIICTPPSTVPRLIAELRERGCKAAAVLTAGLDAANRQAMLDAAKPGLLRVLGPNCLGLMVPRLHMNASFAHTEALPGRLAFVSQSGALFTAVVDWANAQGIGFSHVVSLGESADVDVGDVIDYLAAAPDTSAILLYIEAVRAGRKFMSAARAAARNKPVIVIKAGRTEASAHAAASHTGALAATDDVYDAVFQRAGMLRVESTEALFDAVETLARARQPAGERLAIVTNGGGPGVMATDALVRAGGQLALLGADTVARLDAVLPATWPRANPIDIIGDAPVQRYADTLRILQDAAEVDAVLMLHAPTAIVASDAIARAVVDSAAGRLPVLTSWLGADAVREARRMCRDAGVPEYGTPEQAVRGFLQVVTQARHRQLLMQTPPAAPELAPDRVAARGWIADAVAAGHRQLPADIAARVLEAYGIPVATTRSARDEREAAVVAEAIGFPVALKIASPDISHKSDVGGVALGLRSAEQIREAALAMRATVARLAPAARVDGFTVQRMAHGTHAFELIVGIASDPVFGPVVLFGHGGTAVERIADRAVALPPLNRLLAADLVSRTRIARLLPGYRDVPGIDSAALEDVLMAVSRMACELDGIAELDINPLVASAEGVMALDARIVIRHAGGDPTARLAILPYPAHLARDLTWHGETLRLRPVRPDDERAYRTFLEALSPADMHARYFCMLRHPVHSQLARMTQIDYAREMCFVIERPARGGRPAELLGECRAMADPDNERAEFAVCVRTDCKGQGLGRLLLTAMIAYSRAHGTGTLYGMTSRANEPMLGLARSLGFETAPDADVTRLLRRLRPANSPEGGTA
ncbi:MULTISPECIES: bifunctional acetate--CoA ligase family protein/GNAT family N-acetyltransferase [unclassified Cupriavidus]|uniref:bifunctional acetate--CoA ligase family protein/GNAT family N-acetyltransferase n=1 Tax=unclassified Cupriavidus TaxID=2640874 RepID=UPI00313BA3EA